MRVSEIDYFRLFCIEYCIQVFKKRCGHTGEQKRFRKVGRVGIFKSGEGKSDNSLQIQNGLL